MYLKSLCFLLLIPFFIFSSTIPLFEPIGAPYTGVYVIEAEMLEQVASWDMGNSLPGYKGSGYIYWNGQSFTTRLQPPSNSELSFQVYIEQAGEYQFRLRNYHNEKNDCFIRFHNIAVKEFITEDHYDNGSISDEYLEEWNTVKEREWIKYFAWKTAEYQRKWNSSGVWHPVKDAHDYSPSVYLEKGIQTISIGPRSPGFNIDRILIISSSMSQLVQYPTSDPYQLPSSDLADNTSILFTRPAIVRSGKAISKNSRLHHKATYLLNGKIVIGGLFKSANVYLQHTQERSMQNRLFRIISE